eukprot:5221727-Amphidinium_carterae.1
MVLSPACLSDPDSHCMRSVSAGNPHSADGVGPIRLALTFFALMHSACFSGGWWAEYSYNKNSDARQ